MGVVFYDEAVSIPGVNLLSLFFGGLSIHLSTALLAHMFSYNMSVILFCFHLDRYSLGTAGCGINCQGSWAFDILDRRFVTRSLFESCLTPNYMLYSTPYLAALQTLIHHLLRVHSYDDRVHHQPCTVRLADT